MIKCALPFLLTLVLAPASPVRAASITSTPWSTSNASALNAFGKADIAQLLTNSGGFAIPAKPNDIGKFTWADLQGNGNLELVATMDVNGRGFFNALYVLWRGPMGRMTAQEIDGWMIRDLQKVIRDLNGDGRDELIIPTVLYQYNTAGTYTWPVIYRLKNGKYVEASRDFPKFYGDKILPGLEQQIAEYQSNSGRANQDMAAVLIMERDKIIRTLGRNPTAGLHEAYRWMNTDEPFLLLAAAATFKDIGGHQEEVNAAGARYGRAVCKRHPRMAMCRRKPPNP